jgi:anti-sigma factor RsiW
MSARNGVSNPVHVETGELIDYFASQLSSERERQIEEHIAGCSACAESSRGVYSLVFDVQRLTAKELANSFANQAMASALASASRLESNASFRPVYDRWLRGLGRASVGVLKAMVRSSGAEFLLDGALSASAWRVSPEFALRGNDPAVPRSERKVILEAPGAKMRSSASFFLRGEDVAIKVAEWPGGWLPLAVLVDLDQTGKSVCGQTTQVAEGQFEIGFQGIKPGPYLLLFDSIEKGQPVL